MLFRQVKKQKRSIESETWDPTSGQEKNKVRKVSNSMLPFNCIYTYQDKDQVEEKESKVSKFCEIGRIERRRKYCSGPKEITEIEDKATEVGKNDLVVWQYLKHHMRSSFFTEIQHF